MPNPIALITGASSGIGEEFARQLSGRGYDLILVARREERLALLAKTLKTQCVIITADLSDMQECFDLYEKVKDREVQILINNAGFGVFGEFIKTPIERELSMIDVNVRAVHILTKKFLPDFLARNSGFILNVASSAGLLPAGPYMSTYYATKAYITSMTSAIAQELKNKKSRVYIGALCPGPVNTEFNTVANVAFGLKGISAQACVAYALDKMFRRQTIIIPTLLMKSAIYARRILSRNTFVRLIGRQQKKKQSKP